MLTRKTIKLSDYIEYPFLIPLIDIDFNIFKDYVVVKTSMIIEPKSKESSKLILQGNHIKLLSILINGNELTSEEYNLSNLEIIFPFISTS